MGTTCNLWTLQVAKQRSKEVQLNVQIWHLLNFMHVFGRVSFSERFLHLLEIQNLSFWCGAIKIMCFTPGTNYSFSSTGWFWVFFFFLCFFFNGVAIDLIIYLSIQIPHNKLQITQLQNRMTVLVLTTTSSLLDSYEACSPVWFGQCLHPDFISGPSLCYYLGSSSSFDLLCPMLVHVPCRVYSLQ